MSFIVLVCTNCIYLTINHLYAYFFGSFQGTRTLVGIDLELSGVIEGVINISERAFERMCNLQFLRFHHPYGDRCHDILYLPQGLSNISRKLRLLHWERYPLTCLPSKFNPEFLVKINMRDSMLEKLWEGNEVSHCYYYPIS